MKKFLFVLFWLFLLAFPSFVIFSRSDLSLIIGNKLFLLNVVQRVLGLTAFCLLFFQIMLGAYMNIARKFLGSFTLKFHFFNGVIVYSLIFLHPLMWIVINYFSVGKIDPYFPFIDVCVLCRYWTDYLYNFGRLSFWLITAAVVAARLRGLNKIRKYWRYLHMFNYLAFVFVSIHSKGLGTDTASVYFVWFYWLAVVLVVATAIYKIYKVYPELKNLFLKGRR